MAGIAIVITGEDGLGRLLQKLRPLTHFEPQELMTAVGALGESQTRRRISEEKTSPDGAPWKENLRGGDILVETGQHLLYSIAYTASPDEAEWGSSWEYAHVHQDGMVIKAKDAPPMVFSLGGGTVFAKQVEIPARPFVGLSTDNERELRELVTDYFGVLQ